MHAEIKPLRGKYYGTEVIIHTGSKDESCVLKVWYMGNYKPSIRELKNLDHGEEFEVCDSHYETQDGYEIAMKIVNAFNDTKAAS